MVTTKNNEFTTIKCYPKITNQEDSKKLKELSLKIKIEIKKLKELRKEKRDIMDKYKYRMNLDLNFKNGIKKDNGKRYIREET